MIADRGSFQKHWAAIETCAAPQSNVEQYVPLSLARRAVGSLILGSDTRGALRARDALVGLLHLAETSSQWNLRTNKSQRHEDQPMRTISNMIYL